jgi:hypothetical protein
MVRARDWRSASRDWPTDCRDATKARRASSVRCVGEMGGRDEDEEGEAGFGESGGREDVEDMFGMLGGVLLGILKLTYREHLGAMEVEQVSSSSQVRLGMKADLCNRT